MTSTLLILVALQQSCFLAAAAVVGAAVYGIIQYENNEAIRHYEAAYEPTYHAAVKAMRAEGYPVQEGLKPDPSGEAKVEINDAYVRVKRTAEKSTMVRIRIGTFDTDENKAKAERILNAIAKELGVK